MNRNSILILIVVLLALIGMYFLMSKSESVSSVISGEKSQKVERTEAPSFELENYKGEIVSSNDFGNKLLVVNAWASWCPFCVDELPDFKLLQDAFPNEIAVIAINRAEPASTAKNFSDILELRDAYTFLLDPSDSFYKSIGGFSMPETIFINKKGEVLRHKRGPFKIEEMTTIVEELLASN